jgi:hypothetical protein
MVAVLARHWWVLAVGALAGAALAFAVATLRPAPYVATAVVGVPVAAPADIGDRAAQAQAAAALLRADPTLASAVGGDLRVLAVEDETTISLLVRADEPDEALVGARAVAARVTGQGVAGVPPGSLVVVAAPDGASLDGTGRGEVTLLGAVLGLLVAAIAVGWRERAATGANPAHLSNL